MCPVPNCVLARGKYIPGVAVQAAQKRLKKLALIDEIEPINKFKFTDPSERENT
jgi:hypothetical protein